MSRTITLQNLYDKKYTTFKLEGLFHQAMGEPETTGAWIIQGAEKNGKTWWALMLFDLLSKFGKAWYISAEEGISKTFQEACKRARLNLPAPNLQFMEYIPIDELNKKLESRKAAKIIFIDNTTIYNPDMKPADLLKLLRKHPDKLFVFLAHEEKGEPYRALAKEVRKMAKLIFRVVGLTVFVSGRCPGGILTIDETKSSLYWGEAIKHNEN